MKIKLLLSLFFFSFIMVNLFATHNYAGNIIFEQTGQKSIRATIITFTTASSVAADRDSLTLCWGDGQCETIARTIEVVLLNDFKYNEYSWTHNYADYGNYTLSMTDPNRNADILNVDFPSSHLVQYHIETTFILSDEFNNSPILLEDPLEGGMVGIPFIHIPNPFDADGDSLAYELISPLGSIGTPAPNYLYPQEVSGTGTGTLTMDESTGTIIWDSPELEGHYVIAFKINEYRNGELISSIIRDMMIEVEAEPDGNSPPEITVGNDVYQVTPGSAVNFDVQFDDPNNDELFIIATGGPFLVDPNAEFNVYSYPTSSPATINFNWTTTADIARNQPYQIVFTAIDNSSDAMYSQKAVQILIDEAPLSNEEKWNSEKLIISPNPANGITNLIIENTALKSGQLSISKINGEILFEKKLIGNNILRLDISDFSKGIYFIKLQNKNEFGVEKLIIN